ncbi:hypothetical protein LAZ67_1002978, partial [Cordylochernes scorpioides]
MNDTILTKLRTNLQKNPRLKWSSLLAKIVKDYNSTPHDVTGFSPNFLLFGDCAIPEFSESPHFTIENARKKAIENSAKHREKWKARHDAKHPQSSFKVGDLVLRKIASDDPSMVKTSPKLEMTAFFGSLLLVALAAGLSIGYISLGVSTISLWSKVDVRKLYCKMLWCRRRMTRCSAYTRYSPTSTSPPIPTAGRRSLFEAPPPSPPTTATRRIASRMKAAKAPPTLPATTSSTPLTLGRPTPLHGPPQPVKRNPYNYYGESAVYNSRPVYGDTEEQRGYPSQPHYVPAVQPDYPQYGPPPSTARPSVARIVVRPRPEASSQYAAPPRKEVRPPRRQKQTPPPPRYQEDDEEEEYDGEATGGAGSIPGSPQQDYPILSSVPRTDFSCRDKVPGFYADMEHRCQLYYLCGPQGTYQSFLCPNGTVFNQQSFVCEWWYNVDCGQAGKFYELNHNLYKQPEPEDQQELSQKPRSSRKLRTRRPPPPE